MNVRPLRDMVLVEEVSAAEKTEGGIFIPETCSPNERKAKVIAVGPGRTLDSGLVKEPAVKPGDRVVFWMSRPPTEVTHLGARCLLLNEAEILAVVD